MNNICIFSEVVFFHGEKTDEIDRNRFIYVEEMKQFLIQTVLNVTGKTFRTAPNTIS